MMVLWSPLSWDGDPTLVPAHIVVGGSKTNLAKADWLLAVLAIVTWKSSRKERGRRCVKINWTKGKKFSSLRRPFKEKSSGEWLSVTAEATWGGIMRTRCLS